MFNHLHIYVLFMYMDKSYGDIFHEMITMPNVQWPEVWQAIYETLYMTVVSTIFAFIFGLINGIARNKLTINETTV
jgi:ABC-type phosphate/phosphonate transport system permease subunit